MSLREIHEMHPDQTGELIKKIDEICDDFEACWLAGEQPRIEDFLGETDNRSTARLLKELLIAEIRLRLQNGQSIDAEDFARRFPGHRSLIADGMAKGRRAGPTPHEAEAMERDSLHAKSGVSVRCPHCNQLVFVAEHNSLTGIVCPSCGIQFGLVHVGTATKLGVIGHFELLERLGMGAFGEVWKARDTKLDRNVAIKIPRKGQLEPGEVDSFLREARATAQLRHPNISIVHEVGLDGGTVYIVSDLVHGVSLSDWLSRQRMTSREAATLCTKIADALHHAHQSGVIHRDLKPQNIMLDAEREPHLMDFGLARRDGGEVSITLDGHILGTPAYMSPEQARGEAHHADRRTDVYSLGVILFQLLTGELPFRGSARMLIHQVLHQDAPSPRGLNSSVPKDLETICLKCMEKDAPKRYATAKDVADELRRFLSGKPVVARPVSKAVRVWRRCLRNPGMASLEVAVVGLLLLLSVAGPMVAVNQARQRQAAVRLSRENKQQLYYAQMNLAGQAVAEHGGISRVRRLVNNWLPEPGEVELRGWEWYYLNSLCHRALSTWQGHDGAVYAVAWSPDGRWLATASQDGRVKIWDPTTGDERLSIDGHRGVVWAVAWSPDGALLATGGKDKSVRIWDSGTGQFAFDFPGHADSVSVVTWSHDGNRLASAGQDGTIRIWDLDPDRKPLCLGARTDRVFAICWSPQSKWLASSGDDRMIRIWDVETKSVRCECSGHEGTVYELSWSPDGRSVASASADGTVRFWDPTNGGEIRSLSAHAFPVRAVTWSPDGARVASASVDGTIKIWDSTSWDEVVLLRGHDRYATSLDWSPDGRRLVSGGVDGAVKMWNPAARRETQTLIHPQAVRSLAWKPDGMSLATVCEDKRIRIWDLATAMQSYELRGPSYDEWAELWDARDRVWSLAWSPDGSRLASAAADGSMNLWDTREWTDLRSDLPLGMERVSAACWSPDGNRIAIAHGRSVKIWDATTRETVTLPEHQDRVLWIAFSPDGTRLASACYDHTIRVWNLATDEGLDLTGHKGHVVCVCWSPDGKRLASASWDWSVKIWDAAAGDAVFTLREHTNRVNSVSWSPGNGTRLASASHDGTVKVWDTSTGQQTVTLRVHTNQVMTVCWSPDGTKLASASLDGTVNLWDATRAYRVEGRRAQN